MKENLNPPDVKCSDALKLLPADDSYSLFWCAGHYVPKGILKFLNLRLIYLCNICSYPPDQQRLCSLPLVMRPNAFPESHKRGKCPLQLMREDRGSAALLWFPTVCWQTATVCVGVRDRPFENVHAFIRLVALYASIDRSPPWLTMMCFHSNSF